MNKLLFAAFILLVNPIQSQKMCQCDTLLFEDKGLCDTLRLRDNSFLFNRYDCDSIYLIYNNLDSQFIISKISTLFLPYCDRLCHNLVFESKNALFFKYGCTPNNDCLYSLISKKNGENILDLREVFLVSIKDKKSFILYFSSGNNKKKLCYNLNKEIVCKTPNWLMRLAHTRK
jgi:hypothetical protein